MLKTFFFRSSDSDNNQDDNNDDDDFEDAYKDETPGKGRNVFKFL